MKAQPMKPHCVHSSSRSWWLRFVRALVGASALVTAVQSSLSQAVGPTIATPLDASVDGLVGCASGGHLYFLVGTHRARLDPRRWNLRARFLDNTGPSKVLVTQACENAPLRVGWIEIFGPTDRALFNRRKIVLADGGMAGLHQIREDFKPHELSCRREAHWVWCSTDVALGAAANGSYQAVDPYVSVKFDLDFYRTPAGRSLLVSSRGDHFFLGGHDVIYRWDDTLVLGYRSDPCDGSSIGRKQTCSPLKYIDVDRDVQQLVRGLINESPARDPIPSTSNAGNR